ncbi:Tyrosine-protein phosphatase precursor [Symmachiella dynata]|uniref:tyrosine-protein phosphatase n=1 Tax=Symmachiella dynata TaxID=2527995 RepID=UPI00118AC789|nr:tyrosine-protein phosphatase [Symmachiella dynata]QDT49786.1 Tyrosine-protein phosphatase precursor [Symmachiella dynata]
MLTRYRTAGWAAFVAISVSVGGLKAADADAQNGSDDDRRHVVLQGQSNFRDIGGYKTLEGRSVKWGEIFRSGHLSRLSDDDVRRLGELNVKTVISFLTEKENQAGGPDRLPQNVREVHRPIDSDTGLAVKILKARQTADFSEVPPSLNSDIHRLLSRDARDEYSALLRDLADGDNRPLVFHCSHGVHRTGTAAAIVLSALGVPWETVRQDYLLSNDYRRQEVERRLEQFRKQAAQNQGVTPDKVDMTNFEAFYRLKGEYIDASFDEAIKQYGSMQIYIRKGLGVDDKLLNQLKNELLE